MMESRAVALKASASRCDGTVHWPPFGFFCDGIEKFCEMAVVDTAMHVELRQLHI